MQRRSPGWFLFIHNCVTACPLPLFMLSSTPPLLFPPCFPPFFSPGLTGCYVIISPASSSYSLYYQHLSADLTRTQSVTLSTFSLFPLLLYHFLHLTRFHPSYQCTSLQTTQVNLSRFDAVQEITPFSTSTDEKKCTSNWFIAKGWDVRTRNSSDIQMLGVTVSV